MSTILHMFYYVSYFPHGATQQPLVGQGLLISRLHDHSVRHTTRRIDLYLITQHSRETDIHPHPPRNSNSLSQQAIGRSAVTAIGK